MIKTLYVRVVLTFIAAVLLGLVSSFFITMGTFALLKEQIVEASFSTLEKKGEQVGRIVEENGLDLGEALIRKVESIDDYEIKLYNREGLAGTFGLQRNDFSLEVSSGEVGGVMGGERYRSNVNNRNKLVVGLPISIDSVSYALFIQPSQAFEEKVLRWIVLFSLGIVLLIGSLFIIIAARYLVKPLRAMKEATVRIAKGDYDFAFEWKKRKDELGELVQSFDEMTRDIKRMEQMRQDFVSNVSHEIQSPLTSISGFSKALKRNSIPEEERNRYLDIIQTESERLSRLSEDLLKLASLDSEHHPFEPRTFDLDEQIRMVAVACEPLWSSKKIELDLDLPRAKLCADEDQLSQVWINLLGNAIKFTPEGGKITVAIRHGTDRIEVDIADSGIGISAEDSERVFERFFKADRSHQKRQSGSGLGLAIVKKIVTLHGGTIRVASEPGRGTIFTVELPSVPPQKKETGGR
ncbi:MAG: histidine kinase [Paenibacillus sp.]|nr:histidine kinase [Paenibacillus sp.]